MQRIGNEIIWNATPHPVTFEVPHSWCPYCNGTFPEDEGDPGCSVCLGTNRTTATVEPDGKPIGASVEQVKVGTTANGSRTVRPVFSGNDAGRATIAEAKAAGATVIIGSIIAAQAYPGEVLAMVPVAGFERVPPAIKRMRSDVFTSYEEPARDA